MLRNSAITRNTYFLVPFSHVPFQKTTTASSHAHSPFPGTSSHRSPISVPLSTSMHKQGPMLQTAPLTEFTFMGSSPWLQVWHRPIIVPSTMSTHTIADVDPSMNWSNLQHTTECREEQWDPANPSAYATCFRHAHNPTEATWAGQPHTPPRG